MTSAMTGAMSATTARMPCARTSPSSSRWSSKALGIWPTWSPGGSNLTPATASDPNRSPRNVSTETFPAHQRPGVRVPGQDQRQAGPGPLASLELVGPVAFEPNDYLQQHASRERCYEIPPDSFWIAATHTRSSVTGSFAYAAGAHGLRRHAARLRKHAAAAGDTVSAAELLLQLRHLHPDDIRPAVWVTTGPSLNEPVFLGRIIQALTEAGGRRQAAVLAEHAAAHTDVTDLSGVNFVLKAMHLTGAHGAISALLARNPAGRVRADSPGAIAALLRTLAELSADHQVEMLADRAGQIEAEHLFAEEPFGLGALLSALHGVGTQQQVHHLADRITVNVDAYQIGPYLLRSLREAGAETHAAALAADKQVPWPAAIPEQATGDTSRTDPDDPEVLATNIRDLRFGIRLLGGNPRRLTALLASDPAAHRYLGL